MNKPQYRHEEKYLISHLEYEYLSRLLSGVLQKDCHASENGEYFIRSLYFDTLDNKAFFQKEGGILERKKIRLRSYDAQAAQVNLEIKNKTGFGVYKESARISRECAKELIAGNCEFLKDCQDTVSLHAYRHLKTDIWGPAVLVDYEREAYVMPVFQVRITFDKNVRARLGAGGFFEENAAMTRIMEKDRMILEVKYNNVLPDHVKAMISSAKKQPMALSKYCMSRSQVG